jgi:hypothetical protein
LVGEFDVRDLGGDAVTEPTITVHKVSAIMPVSVEMLLDAGVITEEQAREQGWAPPPPMPWRRKMRWRFQAWRERAGRRVGSWIAGVKLTDGYDEWGD